MGKWTIRRLNVDIIEKTASPKLFDRSDPSSSKHYQKKKMSLLPLLAAFR